jgi:hypothetical protein
MTPADPAHLWAPDGAAVRSLDLAGETVLDILAQIFVGGELGSLGTPGTPLGVPLRRCGSILKLAAARGGIATQLAGDRRRRTAQRTCDLSHATPAGMQNRYLLAFGE